MSDGDAADDRTKCAAAEGIAESTEDDGDIGCKSGHKNAN
jgi:hypothetical protein